MPWPLVSCALEFLKIRFDPYQAFARDVAAPRVKYPLRCTDSAAEPDSRDTMPRREEDQHGNQHQGCPPWRTLVCEQKRCEVKNEFDNLSAEVIHDGEVVSCGPALGASMTHQARLAKLLSVCTQSTRALPDTADRAG